MAYIGLQSLPYDVSQRYFCDGNKLGYTNWMPGKPDDGDLNDDGCVVIDGHTGQWDDWTCAANAEIGPWAAVCQRILPEKSEEDEEGGNCPEGFKHCPSSTNCYKVLSASNTLFGCLRACC